MKNLGILCFLTSAAFGIDAPQATLRIGYVELQKALETIDAGKLAKSTLDKEVSSKKAELEKTQLGLQTEAEEFEKRSAIMNEAAKLSKQKELQKKFMDFQKSMADSQVELQKKERELTKPLIDELKAIIQGLGKEKGLQLILEKNEGAVLYAEAGTDLTSTVIERFNSQHKGKTKKK